MPAGQNGYALLNKKFYVEMWNPEQSQGFGNTVRKYRNKIIYGAALSP